MVYRNICLSLSLSLSVCLSVLVSLFLISFVQVLVINLRTRHITFPLINVRGKGAAVQSLSTSLRYLHVALLTILPYISHHLQPLHFANILIHICRNQLFHLQRTFHLPEPCKYNTFLFTRVTLHSILPTPLYLPQFSM